VAKPYEPTVREAETLANFEKRKAKQIPAPCVKVTMSEDEIGKTNARIEVNHQDAETGYRLLPEALGTSDSCRTCRRSSFFRLAAVMHSRRKIRTFRPSSGRLWSAASIAQPKLRGKSGVTNRCADDFDLECGFY
jgi:hypothetical protein